jgi:biotin operon repressor
MDEAIKKSIEASVVKLLHARDSGLLNREMVDAIDEVESPAELSMVLNDMSRRGLVVVDKESKRWCWNGDAAAGAASPAKKLHETAEAILAAFVGREVGAVLTAGELNAACAKWSPANVGYHIKSMKKAGLIVAAKNGKGYHLPNVKPAAPSAKSSTRRPNTALVSERAKAKEPAPGAIPPPAPAAKTPAPVHDISIGLTCPAGHIKVEGTPKLVFGFLEQLLALAA